MRESQSLPVMASVAMTLTSDTIVSKVVILKPCVSKQSPLKSAAVLQQLCKIRKLYITRSYGKEDLLKYRITLNIRFFD